MLSYDTIEFHTLELLKSLMQEPSFSAMLLVGGTALALQYGHRQSIDLDFFGDLKCEKSETKNILSQYGKVTVLKETGLTRQSPWRSLTKHQRYPIEKERNVPYPTQLASKSFQLGIERFCRCVGSA